MARRRKTTPFEDLIHLASLLPWWLALTLAPLAWLLLHGYASRPLALPSDPRLMAEAMSGSVFRALATLGQYLLPLALLVGAAVSLFGRWRRRRLLATAAAASQPGRIVDGIDWREFEQLVGEVFRRRGFAVRETGGGGPDGGVDLVLQQGAERYLVQCKQWRAVKVGVAVIREFFGVMAAQGATGGFVVTAGSYTEEARAFAAGRNIQLVDGAQLERWIAEQRRGGEAVVGAPDGRGEDAAATAGRVAQAYCPVCSAAMVLRTAKRGASAGTRFWGCSRYPVCRGLRRV